MEQSHKSPLVLFGGIVLIVIAIGFFFGARNTYKTAEHDHVMLPAKTIEVNDIRKHPDDIPPPITRTDNELVVIELDTQELVAEMMPGVTYQYWTYNGTVPGPFMRVKEGDDVEVRLSHGVGEQAHGELQLERFSFGDAVESFLGTHVAHANGDDDHLDEHMHDDTHAHDGGADQHAAEGHAAHSIDLHAVIGPGGGAPLMQAAHGTQKAFRFQALRPGIYIYHCASPHVPTHIANGMYGMILVEPKEGMSEVDHEFYVMQGDFYTYGDFGEPGHQEFSKERLLNEDPSYFVYNGRVGALTGSGAMRARAGERIRMYVGVGSHVAANFHIIGGIFDELYKDGSLSSPPLENVQTTIIPAGGAVMIEFTPEIPGTYLLVDHSLTRTFDKGALAEIVVDGPERPEIYSAVE